MFAIKYKINDGDFNIHSNSVNEIATLTLIGLYPNGAGINTPSYGNVSDTEFYCYNKKNIPETLKQSALFGDFTITIKKMTSKELVDTGDEQVKDVFGWIKQKISNTTNVPEGFELPIVTKDTITLYSHAVIMNAEMPMIYDDEGLLISLY